MTLSKCVAALISAVTIEIIATTLLSLSNSFQRPVIGMTALICYGLSYYCLSVALHRIHIGVAYAIWSAVGILSIAFIQQRYFDFIITHETIAGLGMVIIGTLILNLAIKQNK